MIDVVYVVPFTLGVLILSAILYTLWGILDVSANVLDVFFRCLFEFFRNFFSSTEDKASLPYPKKSS